MGIFKALSNLTAKSNELAGQAEFQKLSQTDSSINGISGEEKQKNSKP